MTSDSETQSAVIQILCCYQADREKTKSVKKDPRWKAVGTSPTSHRGHLETKSHGISSSLMVTALDSLRLSGFQHYLRGSLTS